MSEVRPYRCPPLHEPSLGASSGFVMVAPVSFAWPAITGSSDFGIEHKIARP
jgi:hypothetical protein